jgi:hypothetical protein
MYVGESERQIREVRVRLFHCIPSLEAACPACYLDCALQPPG